MQILKVLINFATYLFKFCLLRFKDIKDYIGALVDSVLIGLEITFISENYKF